MSTSKLFHCILTRFNVNVYFDLPPAELEAHLARGRNEQWLERRFALFEQCCLPSIAKQSVLDFHWFLFFDNGTPERFKTRIAAWQQTYPFIRPVFCSFFDDALALRTVRDAIQQTGADTLLTTRMDNDDMVHPRFIEFIRCVHRRQTDRTDLRTGYFIAFPLGFVVHDGDYYLHRYRNNPFVTYVSCPETERSVFCTDHRYISEKAPVVYDWHSPLWCQIFHGENVANAVRGVYFPWGARTVFAELVPAARRPWGWRMAEMGRSGWRYLFQRERWKPHTDEGGGSATP